MPLKHGESESDFIRRVTARMTPPLVPELQLHLAEESIALWEKTEEALEAVGLPPPFWAFAWAGGQALARYVLDHPDTVRNKSVLDFAAGGGIAGIGAAKAAAARIEASEIDDFAVAAIQLNAALNGVDLIAANEDVVGVDKGWDVVLAADVFYEDALSKRIETWLQRLHDRGATVLIGDPGRHFLPQHKLECLAEYEVPVTRDLEDREIRNARVWKFKD
ncbi:class I SAM-dependent methyltransferase [Hyphobacterium sp.]|uniref:class I SAM-dependent methyltransferase n=1 Tax=Hyphobacterium sp. TaxID=2004662 RepID=UPI003BA85515